MACVTSVADYGCQIFWKGQASFAKQLQSLQNTALRKILGIFRTSPILPAEVEAALPPAKVRLDSATRQYAFRARKLPPTHLVRIAILDLEKSRLADPDPLNPDSPQLCPKQQKGPPRQLERIIQSIQKALPGLEEEKIISHSFLPWQKQTPFQVSISKLDKEEQSKIHKSGMATKLGENFLAIYSDASSVVGGKGIGVGLAAYDYSQNGREIFSTMNNIGLGQIVYNGELEGITQGFEFASTIARPHQEIRIYADNQAAIHRIKAPSDKPGQSWQLRCIKAARKVKHRQAKISIHWVPGHTDIPGNERADSLAKSAAKQTPISNITSLAMTGIKIKGLATIDWQKILSKSTPQAVQNNRNSYAATYSWKIGRKLKIPLGTKREIASAFYQLKIGHGYNKGFLYRIGKADSPLCSCGVRQTPEHLLLSCKWFSEERQILKQDLPRLRLSLPILLHTKQGIAATLSFIKRTKISTRRWYLGQEQEQEEQEED
jgi:ribonuclease HI